MNKDLITIDENGTKKDYKLLAIIDKEYKYIVYTEIDNDDLEEDLYVAKVKSLDDTSETMEISNSEWQMIEKEYNNLLDTI